MKNLKIIIGIIAAVILTSCKTHEPLAQHPLRDNLPEVKTKSSPSSPKTSTFKSPDKKLRILIQTWIYLEMEDSYVLVKVDELNSEGKITPGTFLYNQKFSRKNLDGKEYRYYIGNDCMVHYSLEKDSIYFVKVFPKNAPLESYIIMYDMSNLDVAPIKSLQKDAYKAPVEKINERK